MGPSASAYLYQLLIQKARTEYQAKDNHEYPEIVIHSIPVPDFLSDMSTADYALGMLEKRVEQLNGLEPIAFGMACNTAHIYFEKLRMKAKAPFISMIHETALAVKQKGLKKIGLLASPSTLKYQLYQRELEALQIEVIVPNTQQEDVIVGVIYDIIHGNLETTQQRLLKVSDELMKSGAEAIILGCTELPLVFPQEYQIPSVSSLDILAEALLKKYYVSTSLKDGESRL